jgi:hypothetical protein
MTPTNEFIIPENSIPAVAMAKRMGYEGIECDVRYTKDKVMVKGPTGMEAAKLCKTTITVAKIASTTIFTILLRRFDFICCILSTPILKLSVF